MRKTDKVTMHRQKLPLDEEYWRNYNIVDQYLIKSVSETERKIFINKMLKDKAMAFKEYLIVHESKVKSVDEEEEFIVIEYSIPSQER